MEDQLTIIVLLTKWYAYFTAVMVWLMRYVIPTPAAIKKTFLLDEEPRKYIILYNVFRLVTGSESWQDRGPSSKSERVDVVPIPATSMTPAMVATTKTTIETKPDREERKDDK